MNGSPVEDSNGVNTPIASTPFYQDLNSPRVDETVYSQGTRQVTITFIH